MLKEGLFVGLIPDGNRSWERQQIGAHLLSRDHLLEAYDRGAEAIKRIVEAARDAGIRIFATWGLSSKNLEERSDIEKEVLFRTFERFLIELRDEWMNQPKNRRVRLVHMGRLDRLAEQAPKVAELLVEIMNRTRDRAGMILALGLDYDGLDEGIRARTLWEQDKYPDGHEGWKFYLDLPRQVPEMRKLDGKKKNLSTPVNLILRTMTAEGSSDYDNEYLHAYRNETRLRRLQCFLPDCTPEQFLAEVEAYWQETIKRGK